MITYKDILKNYKEQKNARKKQIAIEAAKRRYDSKPFTWKLFHKKLSPQNIDFEIKSVEEINNLYMDDSNVKSR